VSGVVVGETVRRHLSSVAYWGFVALLAIVALGTSRFNSPAAMWPTLVSLLSIITGAALIGPEFSSGTLQLILVKPVNRSTYLLSRVAGVVLVVWLAAAVAAGAELLGRLLWTDSLRAAAVGTALANVAADAVFTVSLLTFFGSFTRAYFNVAIYVVLQFGLGIATAIAALARKYPMVIRTIEQISTNLFPEPPRGLDGPWLLLVFSNAAVALVAACFLFRSREVPYGAD
jgi:ABC-type transport system involved in multi-copper enzyme maturation permease subunit